MTLIDGIDLITYVVIDQDEAIEFYVDTLGCELVQDEAYGDAGRWVEIGIRGTNATLAIKTPDMFDEAEQVL